MRKKEAIVLARTTREFCLNPFHIPRSLLVSELKEMRVAMFAALKIKSPFLPKISPAIDYARHSLPPNEAADCGPYIRDNPLPRNPLDSDDEIIRKQKHIYGSKYRWDKKVQKEDVADDASNFGDDYATLPTKTATPTDKRRARRLPTRSPMSKKANWKKLPRVARGPSVVLIPPLLSWDKYKSGVIDLDRAMRTAAQTSEAKSREGMLASPTDSHPSSPDSPLARFSEMLVDEFDPNASMPPEEPESMESTPSSENGESDWQSAILGDTPSPSGSPMYGMGPAIMDFGIGSAIPLVPPAPQPLAVPPVQAPFDPRRKGPQDPRRTAKDSRLGSGPVQGNIEQWRQSTSVAQQAVGNLLTQAGSSGAQQAAQRYIELMSAASTMIPSTAALQPPSLGQLIGTQLPNPTIQPNLNIRQQPPPPDRVPSPAGLPQKKRPATGDRPTPPPDLERPHKRLMSSRDRPTPPPEMGRQGNGSRSARDHLPPPPRDLQRQGSGRGRGADDRHKVHPSRRPEHLQERPRQGSPGWPHGRGEVREWDGEPQPWGSWSSEADVRNQLLRMMQTEAVSAPILEFLNNIDRTQKLSWGDKRSLLITAKEMGRERNNTPVIDETTHMLKRYK
ncbi:hypothetical protein HK097_004307 [Rhizophlyctis rosea]|uniref:Uncharacterized protein n=1 Tax=Rhizophlyctis rosea TaxID=64517 RepID=A0AAD5SG59_9FUNG|nr:hypothetical protein HK097_004307 [Rhizophlyctis rosea]